MKETHNYTFQGLEKLTPTGDLDHVLDLLDMDFDVLNLPLHYDDPRADIEELKEKVLSFVGSQQPYAFKRAQEALEALMDTRVTSPVNRQIIHEKKNLPMGVVGLGYTEQPYPEAFALAKTLIKHGAKIVGGGCLGIGERAILILEAPGVFTLAPGDDIVNRFCLLSGHTGSDKIEIRMTPWRKLTGTAITFDATRPLAFKHTRKVGDRIKRAKRIIKSVNSEFEEFTLGARKMVAYPIKEKDARSFIELVMPDSGPGGPSDKMLAIREHIYTIFTQTGIGTRLPYCQNTVFGLVQAFAEWADIHKTVRTSKRWDDRTAQLDAKLISDGAKKKQRAYAMGLFLVNNNKLKGRGEK